MGRDERQEVYPLEKVRWSDTTSVHQQHTLASLDSALIKAEEQKMIWVIEPTIVKQNSVVLGTRTQPMQIM